MSPNALTLQQCEGAARDVYSKQSEYVGADHEGHCIKLLIDFLWTWDEPIRTLTAELGRRGEWHHPACRKMMYDHFSSPCTCEFEVGRQATVLTEQLEQATEALRYTAFYGSSVPLGMSAEDYYHGAMNDLISHAARALPSNEKKLS